MLTSVCVCIVYSFVMKINRIKSSGIAISAVTSVQKNTRPYARNSRLGLHYITTLDHTENSMRICPITRIFPFSNTCTSREC